MLETLFGDSVAHPDLMCMLSKHYQSELETSPVLAPEPPAMRRGRPVAATASTTESLKVIE